ncbi:MAG: glycosyltransferase [Phycisphaerales bacterium]|nr:glycosyltransferase [Phycisphaerales bacterium]
MAPEAGGPPVVAAGLAGALADRGHSLAIATVESPGQSPIPLHPAVTLHSFPLTGSPRYAASRPLDQWLTDHTSDFDILHLHGIWQFPTFAAAHAARKNRIPYITVPHGMLDRYSIQQRSGLLKRIYWFYRERAIHAHAAAIHCLNQAEIDNAVPWIHAFPKFILPNGIFQSELDHLPAKGLFRNAHPTIADRPMILFLSRVHPKKGLDRLIPAWQCVAEKLPDSLLAIAGTGELDYLAHINNLIAPNNLQKNILLVGQLKAEKKWQALVDADLFVLPSHQEGFSMAITEALAASCPVIATKECNFDELASPPPCGIIIENGDMSTFTAAAIELLSNPAKRAQFAAAARALVQARYTWEKIAASLEQTYYQLLSACQPPALPGVLTSAERTPGRAEG